MQSWYGMATPNCEPRIVLIFHNGSIGDTVVALPAYHLIARLFVQARRILLTNFPDAGAASSVFSLIGPSDLVNDYIDYRAGRNPFVLWRLLSQIRALKPDLVIYLAQPHGQLKAYRDLVFFRLCGVPHVIGVPTKRIQQQWIRRDNSNLWESEAQRLSRCLIDLGDLE